MANTALKKIVIRAKQLQRSHPNTPWISLIKRASKEYNSGSIHKAPKKKRSVKPKRVKTRRVAKRTVRHKRQSTYVAPGQLTSGQLKSQLKGRLNDQLDKLVVRKFRANKKREKNKIQKTITKVKSDLRKFN